VQENVLIRGMLIQRAGDVLLLNLAYLQKLTFTVDPDVRLHGVVIILNIGVEDLFGSPLIDVEN